MFLKGMVIGGSGKPYGSVRKETIVVSGTMQISVPNLRLRPLLLHSILVVTKQNDPAAAAYLIVSGIFVK